MLVLLQSSPLDREIFEKKLVVQRPSGFGNMQGDGHVLVEFGRLEARPAIDY
jgi:hypothetical protein